MSEFHAVIMAGGSGTRFWPASRAGRPKQLLPLAGGTPLLAATVDRLAGLVATDATWIVTNVERYSGIREAMPEFPTDRIIVEPEARDTAPCIALAAAHVEAVAPGTVMAVMPADHVIAPIERFQELVRRGVEIARAEPTLVTFGIPPTRPATAYGYIEPGDSLDDLEPAAWRVRRFREKPNRSTAEEFLTKDRMLWNSGIFVWTTEAILGAMDSGAPELAAATRAMLAAANADDQSGLEAAFRSAPRISVDFAVLERAPRVVVVTADLQWNDLGSFLALEAVQDADDHGNVRFLLNGARDIVVDSENCVIYSDSPRTVALLGARDLVVVSVEDAVLVCPRDHTEDIRKLYGELRKTGRSDLL